MIKRCIMIFPNFDNMNVIDNVRKKYDTLAEHVRPHITLVFPFESNIDTNGLEEHIERAVSNIKPFELVLSSITPSTGFGNYLFLNVREGSKEITELHKRLYSGILKDFYPAWLIDTEYMPHMTVGNINDIDKFHKAVEETKEICEIFKTNVNTVSVEIIDENEDSIIELNIPLTQ